LNDSYNPKEADFALRENVHQVHSKIEQVYYGILDDMSENERREYLKKLKATATELYDDLNQSILHKAEELSRLNSEISRINQELEVSNEDLRENQRFKDFLFNIIVHDMKNPAVAILGYLDVIQRRDLSGNELKSTLGSIKDTTIFLRTMIMSLLDISRIEDNQMVPVPEQIDLSEVIEESMSLFKLQAEIKQVKVTINVAPKTTVKIDPGIFQRVLINLLSNAFKHVNLQGEVVISYNKGNVDILNTGNNIPEEIQTKIFDRFFSFESDGLYQSGTGLGLAYCDMAIEACGGTIEVTSPLPDARTGALFTLQLKT
jgi:two-component system sensor histidine kinase/response regulator